MAETVSIYSVNDLFYEYTSNRKCIFIRIPGHQNYYLRTRDIKAFKQMLYKLYKKSYKPQNEENSFLYKHYSQDIKVSDFNPDKKLFFYSKTAIPSKKEIGFYILQDTPKMTYSLVGIYLKPQTQFDLYKTIILNKREILRVLKFLATVENFLKTNNNI